MTNREMLQGLLEEVDEAMGRYGLTAENAPVTTHLNKVSRVRLRNPGTEGTGLFLFFVNKITAELVEVHRRDPRQAQVVRASACVASHIDICARSVHRMLDSEIEGRGWALLGDPREEVRECLATAAACRIESRKS